ncbi:MAG: response regulator [Anaerolineaceae bacterium]|nr:response regulator [Anaerolineaceae bacterium]
MDKPKIMIVEDDLDLAEMLNAYFRVQNYDVVTAAWGREAIDISEQEDLQLVVLDIRLPDIDGYEVCRHLRLQRRTQNLPIIFLTEKRDRVDKLQGLELGVVDYITKPFDIQELRLRVRNALNRVERQNTVNPVTDLPEGEMVNEHLNGLIYGDAPWSLLLVSIGGLAQFREMYGFVAADDVLRAVTLMVRNAVREFGGEGDFIGHLGSEEFLIVTTPERVTAIRERVETRINQSREYFYPLRDRDKARVDLASSTLKLHSGILTSDDGVYSDIDALKVALHATTLPDES